MESVVKILMRRDKMTRQDAEDLINETRELILSSLLQSADPVEADEIMADMLGLEPDYIFEILGY